MLGFVLSLLLVFVACFAYGCCKSQCLYARVDMILISVIADLSSCRFLRVAYRMLMVHPVLAAWEWLASLLLLASDVLFAWSLETGIYCCLLVGLLLLVLL